MLKLPIHLTQPVQRRRYGGDFGGGPLKVQVFVKMYNAAKQTDGRPARLGERLKMAPSHCQVDPVLNMLKPVAHRAAHVANGRGIGVERTVEFAILFMNVIIRFQGLS
ncbi:hypothetical protein PsYK624_005850 [Phanerochaete sordida]|uniref:Uncharacterized protein n=1 Tax=Phanerochaete sordida TaxID=48140 RepID=A0A9P3FY88_9APHY|nr:hypothetical protein PsYK624_005850 [Phanerochaete sordida]